MSRSTLARLSAGFAGLLLAVAACSGGDNGNGEVDPPEVTPDGQCSARTPILALADLQDPTAQQNVIDVPPRLPFEAAGARMDAQSNRWVYRQTVYVTESGETASQVLNDTYPEPTVPDAPSFGDESAVWTTRSGEADIASVWIRKGPTATVLTLQPGFGGTAEASSDKVIALAATIDAKLAACEQWSPPVTASPTPTHSTAISIVGRDNVFEPLEVTVETGEMVEFTFTNQGEGVHNLHIANPETGLFTENICEGITDPCLDPFLVQPGESSKLVWQAPENPVTIEFRCDLHPREMNGAIHVE